MGNDTGLTHGEQRAHFALWSLYKSPLMIGHDLRNFSAASLSILLSEVGWECDWAACVGREMQAMCVWRACNKEVFLLMLAAPIATARPTAVQEVIAVNQDDLGVAGDLVWRQGTKRVGGQDITTAGLAVALYALWAIHPHPHPLLISHTCSQIYAGPLSAGARAVVLANFQTPTSQYPRSNITVFWEQIGLQPGQRARVRDLYARRDLGVYNGAFTAAVAVRDVAALRVTPLEGPLDDGWRPWQGQAVYASDPANAAVQLKQSWVGRGAPWSQFNAASQRVTFAGVVQEAGGGGEGGGGGGGKAHHRKLAAPV